MNTKWWRYRCVAVLVAMLAAGVSDCVAGDTLRHSFRDRLLHAIRPRTAVVQFAGNMGQLSAGVGWDTWRGRLSTELLVGYVPKSRGHHIHPIYTIKENVHPWTLSVNERCQGYPIYGGMYLTAIVGDKFWLRQPGRYPDKYYAYMSTEVRLNMFLGTQFEYKFRRPHLGLVRSVSAFYEISTYDLNIRAMFQEGNDLRLEDVVTMSVGLRVKIK